MSCVVHAFSGHLKNVDCQIAHSSRLLRHAFDKRKMQGKNCANCQKNAQVEESRLQLRLLLTGRIVGGALVATPGPLACPQKARPGVAAAQLR